MTKYTTEQEMDVENDTLIITDPCYLLKEEHWKEWLNLNIGLDEYLRKYHNFGKVIATDTGYGDWSNEVMDSETKKVLGQFTADAGMVIVCTVSDLTNYGYDKDQFDKLIAAGCIAVVPDYTGTVTLDYEYKNKEKLAVIYGTSENDTCFNTLGWAA